MIHIQLSVNCRPADSSPNIKLNIKHYSQNDCPVQTLPHRHGNMGMGWIGRLGKWIASEVLTLTTFT